MAKGLTTYLRRLRFDPKLATSFHAKIVTNFRLVLMFIVLIVSLGLASFFTIPRRLNPEVKIPIVTVMTILPGANPEDIESLVTIPIEDKVNGATGIDTITSVSTEGLSNVTIQFLSRIDPDEAKTEVDSLVSQLTGLPEEALTPIVSKIDFENQPVWIFVLKGGRNYASLMRFADILDERLENDPKVDRVVVSGLDDQQISVKFDPVKITELTINPALLSQAISRAANSYPSGSVKTDANTYALTIDSQITSLDDLRKTRISLPGQAGQSVSLGEIAVVSEESKQNQKYSFIVSSGSSPEPSVQFSVFKVGSADIDEASLAMEKVVEETLKEYDDRFSVVTIINTSDEISKQFDELVSEFGSTILLVFVNLLIFLGLRQAFISSLTVPLTFLASISVLNALGYSLNFLTMFAFLLTLGLLIDDTIVTVTAMTRYFQTGRFSGKEAGLLVWRDFIVPLWSTTITTIWAFVPLLIASGIIGEFIKPIPVVVTTTMLSSTSIAVLITLPLMMIILDLVLPSRVKVFLRFVAIVAVVIFGIFFIPKTPLFPVVFVVYLMFFAVFFLIRRKASGTLSRKAQTIPLFRRFMKRSSLILHQGLINTEALSFRYMRIIERIVSSASARRRTLLLVVVFAFIGYLLIPLGFVTNEFFPKVDQDQLSVAVDMPAGTNTSKTKSEALRLLNELKHTPYTEYATVEIGAGASADGFSLTTDNASSFVITLKLVPKEERQVESQEIAQNLREKYARYHAGILQVQELSGGPPAGADIQIKLLGEDLGILTAYADKIKTYLEREEGITNVQKSVRASTSKILFVPDREKLAEVGLSVDTIGLWLRSEASGFTLDTVRFGGEDKDIIFAVTPLTKSPQDLTNITITSSSGAVYPLSSLGSIELRSNPTIINREAGKRTISVSAALLPGYVLSEKNQALERFADSLDLPPGYSWVTGGVNEENQKSVQSIFYAMGISFLLILVTMVIEFNSFRQAFIALTTIPLAVAGVFYLFALTGTPLSFPALIGVLSLFGIEVTTVIVLVEKINDNRKEGFSLKESVVEASGSRLEPILLTSITSILGLIPITIADPLWRGLGGAIIAGLLIGGFVKLFYVPIMYYAFFSRDEKYKRVTK